jgi:hypothetical protein
MTVAADEVVVVARGRLADESAALALRVALAIPLGGSSVRLFLTEATCLLALAGPSQIGSLTERQMDSLIHDEEAPVAVERESLARFGLRVTGGDRGGLRRGPPLPCHLSPHRNST